MISKYKYVSLVMSNRLEKSTLNIWKTVFSPVLWNIEDAASVNL